MVLNDNRKIIPVADAAALAKTAAERLIARIAANSDRVAICLTGGSSPKRLYELLATDFYKNQIPWDRVHWFIGDERFVPATDPRNNMRMARQAFLNRCAPLVNIHPMATNAENPDEAALRYETELKSFYGADNLDCARPLFDVVLMGVGPDGHIASLFPGLPGDRGNAALGGRRPEGPRRTVGAARFADIARARFLPRNAVRSKRRGQARDSRARTGGRGSARQPGAFHRRHDMADRCSRAAGELPCPVIPPRRHVR